MKVISEAVLFGLGSDHGLHQAIAGAAGMLLAMHEERPFEDGEYKLRPLQSVRGRDTYVVASLYGDEQRSVDDKLCRMLFFLGTLRDASAARVTAVMPYLCYARKDRRTKPRDPVTTRYVASLFEAMGVDRVMAVDVHDRAAFDNAFRIPAEHIRAQSLFVEHFAALARERDVLVLSPDIGGIKRAEELRRALSEVAGREIPSGFMEKYRSGGAVTGAAAIGDIEGKTVIVIDDSISSGGTLARAARACRARGAREVHAAATHGLFVGDATRVLGDAPLDRIAVTSTVPPFRLDPEMARAKLTVLDIGPLIGAAIRRVHDGESLTDLCGP
jgi:ribose-phosphate pyrophosphokinase